MGATDGANDQAEPGYEWCVMHYRHPDVPHRGPMSEDEARAWVHEWTQMGENANARQGMLYVARRPVGPWERID